MPCRASVMALEYPRHCAGIQSSRRDRVNRQRSNLRAVEASVDVGPCHTRISTSGDARSNRSCASSKGTQCRISVYGINRTCSCRINRQCNNVPLRQPCRAPGSGPIGTLDDAERGVKKKDRVGVAAFGAIQGVGTARVHSDCMDITGYMKARISGDAPELCIYFGFFLNCTTDRANIGDRGYGGRYCNGQNTRAGVGLPQSAPANPLVVTTDNRIAASGIECLWTGYANGDSVDVRQWRAQGFPDQIRVDAQSTQPQQHCAGISTAIVHGNFHGRKTKMGRLISHRRPQLACVWRWATYQP